MKSKIIRFLSYILVAALACVITLFCTVKKVSDSYTKLEQLEALILERFIGETDQTAMEDAAAEAMVESLGDRWSYYLTAEEYTSYLEQMANSYVGIGTTVQAREDAKGIDIVQVTAGGPAEEAGILAGDVIVAVDGQSVEGMDTTQVRNLIRGEAGTKVTITVLREEERKEIAVERRQIETPVATLTMLESNIALIAIENFDSRCAEETIAAIDAAMDEGAEALIFDVRYNPGGYASELVDVLNYLLPEGTLFRRVDYTGAETVDKSDAKCVELPMAVLVNGSSYSAAEFFAAALQEYEWAVVVGEQTSGKGYFQNTFQLLDGSAVGLSVGKYYTPKGVSLADTGITPDVPIEVDTETAMEIYYGTMDPMEDPQILAAIEALR